MLPISPPTWQAPSRPVSAARQGNYPEAEVFPWRRRWAISWSSGCAPGASSACSAIPGTASTGSWLGSSTPATSARASSRRATRSWPRSWRERTQNLPGSRECASPPPGRGPSTCSTGCMTPAWITSRWSRSWVIRHHRARRRLSAGGRSADAVQGRGTQFRHHRCHPFRGAACHRPRVPHRALREVRPYSEFLPKEGQARGVQIDLKGRMLGIRYPMEVNLHGDAAETLRALLPYLKRKASRRWRQDLEASMREWKKILEAHAGVEAKPLNPAFVYRELNKRLPERAIFTADSGSTATWYARYLDFRAGMMGSLSGNLATMGPAMPYAVAAKLAFPDRPVFALVGDGAMQMNGNNVLITVMKYWKEWKDPRFIVLVLNNRDLNMVTWELRAQSGEPKFEGSQEIPDFPYAAYAESLGFMGLRVDRPEDVARTWDVVLAADRPVLVEAVVDPEFPMIPPHVTLKEATAYAKSVLKGEPDAKHMIGETIKTVVAGVFKKDGEKGE